MGSGYRAPEIGTLLNVDRLVAQSIARPSIRRRHSCVKTALKVAPSFAPADGRQ